jgi:hypothetical protein
VPFTFAFFFLAKLGIDEKSFGFNNKFASKIIYVKMKD